MRTILFFSFLLLLHFEIKAKAFEFRNALYLDSNTRDSQMPLWKKFLPNGFSAGFNYNTGNYGFTKYGNRVEMDDRSFEIGLGRYYFEKSDVYFPESHFIAGGSLGWEYRFPMQVRKLEDSLPGAKFNPNVFNIRTEVGFSFDFLGQPLALHLQFGYSTDFTKHYLKPGVGLSLGRLQIGYQNFVLLGHESPKTYLDGLYVRIIFTSNTFIDGVVKQKRSLNGR